MIIFTPLETFFSKELMCEYVKDHVYKVKPENYKLALLVEKWQEEGKVIRSDDSAVNQNTISKTVTTFTPLKDFFSEELKCEYVKDLVYKIKPNNHKLASLAKKWKEEGKIVCSDDDDSSNQGTVSGQGTVVSIKDSGEN